MARSEMHTSEHEDTELDSEQEVRGMDKDTEQEEEEDLAPEDEVEEVKDEEQQRRDSEQVGAEEAEEEEAAMNEEKAVEEERDAENSHSISPWNWFGMGEEDSMEEDHVEVKTMRAAQRRRGRRRRFTYNFTLKPKGRDEEQAQDVAPDVTGEVQEVEDPQDVVQGEPHQLDAETQSDESLIMPPSLTPSLPGSELPSLTLSSVMPSSLTPSLPGTEDYEEVQHLSWLKSLGGGVYVTFDEWRGFEPPREHLTGSVASAVPATPTASAASAASSAPSVPSVPAASAASAGTQRCTRSRTAQRIRQQSQTMGAQHERLSYEKHDFGDGGCQDAQMQQLAQDGMQILVEGGGDVTSNNHEADEETYSTARQSRNGHQATDGFEPWHAREDSHSCIPASSAAVSSEEAWGQCPSGQTYTQDTVAAATQSWMSEEMLGSEAPAVVAGVAGAAAVPAAAAAEATSGHQVGLASWGPCRRFHRSAPEEDTATLCPWSTQMAIAELVHKAEVAAASLPPLDSFDGHASWGTFQVLHGLLPSSPMSDTMHPVRQQKQPQRRVREAGNAANIPPPTLDTNTAIFSWGTAPILCSSGERPLGFDAGPVDRISSWLSRIDSRAADIAPPIDDIRRLQQENRWFRARLQ